MEELSLDDLLSSLTAVQEKKVTAKLSERNVIELVNKLKQLGLLGDELLHTSNGREYITRQQVTAEVAAAVDEAGGRIPLVDLPPLLGVDLVHCERAAEQLVQEGGGAGGAAAGAFQSQGELFTPAYFDGLAAEVDEGLQEAGVVALGDTARRYALATDLLASQLEPRVGSIVRGKLEGGVIYTQAYLARIKAQLRGALRGALAPVSIPSLVKQLGLEGLGSLQSLLPTLVEQLVAEGAVAGKLSAGSASWVPALFVRSQQDAVKRFFQQNGYIGYDTVSRYGIPAPRAFLQQHFPDGIVLDSAFVAPSVVDQVEASAEEALGAGAWCDVQPLLPSILSPSDAAALLGRCVPALQRGAAGAADPPRVLAGTCLVAPSFLEGIKGVLLEEARKAADEAHRKQPSGAAAAAAAGDAAKGGAPGKQGKPAATESDSDDDWDTGKGRGKKGKGKKGKAPPAKPSVGKASKGGKQAAAEGGAAGAAAPSVLSVDSLAQRIADLHPDVEGAGADGELATELAAELRPAVAAEYERALHAIFTAGAERRRRAREAAGAALDEAHTRLQLFSHGMELFSADEATLSTLERHLLRTSAADCMDALLRYLAADLQQGEGEGGAAEGEGAPAAASAGPLAPPERAAIAKQLGPDVRPAVSAALEKLGGASLEAFTAELGGAAEAAGLRLRRLDKKGEKARVAEQARAWEAQLGGEGDASSFLLVLAPYLVARHLGRLVSLPGRALGAAVERLRGELPEDGYGLLADLHAAVVAQLRAGGGESSGGGGAEPERLGELVAAARQRLVAGGGGGVAD